jgi:hypothetical protein
MSEIDPTITAESPVALEINTNHRYKADEMGVIEFRIKNQGPRPIRSLDLMLVDCPCERSKSKSETLKNLAPSSEKKAVFQFEPEKGGEALLRIALRWQDENGHPMVFQGKTWVSISSKNEGSSSQTSFTLDIHDIEKFMGNDLSELIGGVGKEKGLDAQRLSERMERKEPFWMLVDLDLDETETMRLRNASRKILTAEGGQLPKRCERALMESMEPTAPRRVYIYSMPQVIFGREAQRSDVVLRFLPDFDKDPRSTTISAEQFVVQYRENDCILSLAPKGHALMSVNHKIIGSKDELPLSAGTDIKIGSCELSLRVSCVPRSEDNQWKLTRGELFRFDPSVDPFENARWDLVSFCRPANGQEEEYFWLLGKIDIGWESSVAAGLQLGRPPAARARLAYWNGRYYLEALGAEPEIKIAGSMLQPGRVRCLDAETDIGFGPHRFRWRLR